MSVTAFRRQGARIRQDAAKALYRCASEIIATSVRLVPVETGTLKASARVMMPTFTPGRVEVRAGFGYGAALNPLTGESPAGYALPVHEDLTKHHPHGQAHFLLDAALQHIHTLGPEVVAAITRGRRGVSGPEIYEQTLAGGE